MQKYFYWYIHLSFKHLISLWFHPLYSQRSSTEIFNVYQLHYWYQYLRHPLNFCIAEISKLTIEFPRKFNCVYFNISHLWMLIIRFTDLINLQMECLPNGLIHGNNKIHIGRSNKRIYQLGKTSYWKTVAATAAEIRSLLS